MNEDIIILKNGKRIKLEWNFLVLEYLEEYEGGLKAIQQDIKFKRNELKVSNMLCYAVINANIDDPLTYREILRLLNLKSLRNIMKFVEKNKKEFDEFKKKDPISFAKKKTKKRPQKR